MREEIHARMGISNAELEDFCRRWNIIELSLFGSALQDDFGPDSDIDLLVRYGPAPNRSLLDHIAMERELTELLGRKVDLVSKRGVESSPNWVIRRSILDSAKLVYEIATSRNGGVNGKHF